MVLKTRGGMDNLYIIHYHFISVTLFTNQILVQTVGLENRAFLIFFNFIFITFLSGFATFNRPYNLGTYFFKKSTGYNRMRNSVK